MNKNILAIGIVFLFVCSAFIPMSLGINTRITDTREQPIPFSRGNTLYVGGSGDGNYTKIKDAVDDASDGDTVFVYDDSSPYNENFITIEKNINLIGENRETTIIDGGSSGHIIHINSYTDGVTVSGFTFRNGDYGIRVEESSNHNIIDNIFIDTNSESIKSLHTDGLIIKNNVFKSNVDNRILNKGVYFWDTTDSTITENSFYSNYRSIVLYDYSNNNEISYNNIGDGNYCRFRICYKCKNNIIFGNNLKSRLDVEDETCNDNLFYHNNFLAEGGYASDDGRNDWDNGIEGNYWHNYKGQDLSPKDGIGDTPYRIPGSGNDDNYPLMKPWRAGNTLYVGGSGEGNYTHIQDAINDTLDRDTVFVYNDSSPYYENIVVNKSINLVGEDRDNTVIDGNNIADVVHISAFGVNMNGFTIQNSGDEWHGVNYAGIDINSSACNISGNIISNNVNGINHKYPSDYNTITGNTITSNNDDGIYLFLSDSNTIKGNIISDNQDGINLVGSSDNTITGNSIISNKEDGVILRFIKSDELIAYSRRNTILKNNFLDNKRNAFFHGDIAMENIWTQNYWNRPRILPVLIFGEIFLWFPWFNIDWNPALKPYDI